LPDSQVSFAPQKNSNIYSSPINLENNNIYIVSLLSAKNFQSTKSLLIRNIPGGVLVAVRGIGSFPYIRTLKRRAQFRTKMIQLQAPDLWHNLQPYKCLMLRIWRISSRPGRVIYIGLPYI